MMNFLVYGLVTGSMYAAVALGLTLTYGILGILNFAHGEMLMVGAYLAYVLTSWGRVHFLIAAVAGALAVGFLGWIIERTTFRFARHEHLNGLVVSLGLVAILQNVALAIWGADPISIPPPFPRTLEFAGIRIGEQRLLTFGLTIGLIVLLSLFLKKTRLGKGIRATAQNPEVAASLGVRTERIVVITFSISTALAGLVGALVGAIYTITPFMGGFLAMKGFVVIILGGLGSVGGSIVAGLMLGVVESFGGGMVSSIFKDGFGFVALILILIFRPWGLFGQRPEREDI
jgi:branched-chain amino acid transport system permease protein